MSFSRYFLNGIFTGQELDAIDERLEQEQLQREEETQGISEEIGELRADFERLALLTRSLAELCLEKGVLSKDELKQRMLELDLADGTQNGRLDPRKTGLDPKGLNPQ
jgi:hypothetical protein